GHVQCRVIAGARDNLKEHDAQLQASLPGIEVRRIAGSLHSRNHAPELIGDDLIRWAAEFAPDVIVSSCDFLADFGRRIQAMHPAPHLLHVEQWFAPQALARREYLGIKALRPLVNRLKHRRFDAFVDHYMIANPAERQAMREAADPSRYSYVAWPHPPLPGAGEPGSSISARCRTGRARPTWGGTSMPSSPRRRTPGPPSSVRPATRSPSARSPGSRAGANAASTSPRCRVPMPCA